MGRKEVGARECVASVDQMEMRLAGGVGHPCLSANGRDAVAPLPAGEARECC